MKKNIFLSSICFAIFTSCTQVNILPSPSPTASTGINNSPNPSSTPVSSVSPVPSASSSITPSPTPSPINQFIKYNLPAKFVYRAECNNNEQKLIYEVKDNIFSYNLNTEIYGTDNKDDIKTVNITPEQSLELKKLIETADLANLSKDDVKVPDGTPMTMECRSILGFSVIIDGKEKLFERNDRNYTHSTKYMEAFDKLKTDFDLFKKDKVDNVLTKEYELGKEFTLKIGETVNIKDESSSLKVNKLIDDSRCPSNVNCIWAGQVSFDMSFKKTINQNFTIGFGGSTTSTKSIDGYNIKLIKVSPTAFTSGNTPKESDYLLTLKVEK